MKVLAITTVPAGLDLRKSGLRYLDATLLDTDTNEVLDQYNSGYMNLPPDLEDQVDTVVAVASDAGSDDEEPEIEYSEAASKFGTWLQEISTEFEAGNDECITIVLDRDNGWINSFLTYNGLDHIELGPNYIRQVIDYSSWTKGIELVNPYFHFTEQFEDSLLLARAFAAYDKKRVSNHRKIDRLVQENAETVNYENSFRSCMGMIFCIGVLFGNLFSCI